MLLIPEKMAKEFYTNLGIAIDTNNTRPDYWDCVCEKDYVHKKEELICTMCHATREESPNAFLDDVLEYRRKKYN